eukprot:scaffold25341_cov38-Attheya_sp.AAC.1
MVEQTKPSIVLKVMMDPCVRMPLLHSWWKELFRRILSPVTCNVALRWTLLWEPPPRTLQLSPGLNSISKHQVSVLCVPTRTRTPWSTHMEQMLPRLELFLPITTWCASSSSYVIHKEDAKTPMISEAPECAEAAEPNPRYWRQTSLERRQWYNLRSVVVWGCGSFRCHR